jgi:hypothetical protein
MSAPMTIYVCPNGHAKSTHFGDAGCYVCGEAVAPVSVFREEDVRPLFDAAQAGVIDPAAIAAFPAPEEWKR